MGAALQGAHSTRAAPPPPPHAARRSQSTTTLSSAPSTSSSRARWATPLTRAWPRGRSCHKSRWTRSCATSSRGPRKVGAPRAGGGAGGMPRTSEPRCCCWCGAQAPSWGAAASAGGIAAFISSPPCSTMWRTRWRLRGALHQLGGGVRGRRGGGERAARGGGVTRLAGAKVVLACLPPPASTRPAQRRDLWPCHGHPQV